jgi:hypothetical protein
VQFDGFADLSPVDVAALVHERMPQGLGVGIHFDGTRRWYMQSFGARPADLYTEHYVQETMRQIRRVARAMFEDGARAVYLPALGARIEAERGPDYARFQMEGLARELGHDEMLAFCRELDVELSCYGRVDRFGEAARALIESLPERTRTPRTRRYLRWGAFAGSPLDDVIERAIRLHRASAGTRVPRASEVIEDYYRGPHVPLGMWIGQECPSIYGVPLLFTSRTNLYFLQFSTPYLDRRGWRRLLYDTLYVRGDQSHLATGTEPDGGGERRVLGLGARVDGGAWKPDPRPL